MFGRTHVPEEALAALCSLPEDGGSVKAFLARVDYARLRPSLSVRSLARYLRGHRDRIDAWLRWSADKRTGGPYFMDPEAARAWWGKERWTVGQFVAAGHHDEAFRDPAKACATYILKELDFWADVDPK
jgi:hypothetical protein